MYYINIVDSNRRKLRVFSDQSQSKLDTITTSFNNSDELLIKLGLDPAKFKVVIERQMTKKEDPEEILFFDSRYRGLPLMSVDKEKQETFFDDVSQLDRRMLYEYFLNEYVTRYDKITNGYDDNRKDRLDKILDLFHDEEEYQKKFGEDKLQFTNKKLSNAIKYFFIDQYGKFNYENVKYLYRYLVLREMIVPEKKELSEFETQKLNKEILKMSQKINKSISIDGKFFDDGKLPTLEFESDKYIEDDEPDYSSDIYKYDDIDERMTELDMYLDSNKMDEEQKNEYIENNKKRLFK